MPPASPGLSIVPQRLVGGPAGAARSIAHWRAQSHPTQRSFSMGDKGGKKDKDKSKKQAASKQAAKAKKPAK